MRLLNLADLHLTDLFPDVIQDDQLKALHQAVTVAREQCCSHIIFLGDTIHDKKLIYIKSLRMLEELILSNQDLTFVFVIGNHDCVNDPTKHGFSTLRYLKNVTIVDTETRLTDEKNNELVFLPYSKTLATQLESTTGTYLFSHFGLNEAQVSPGISVPHAIRFSHLLNFQRIFLGHFHLPQDLEFGNQQHVHYVGSTNARDWNDKNQEKRFLVFDSCKNSITSIQVRDTLQFHELYLDDKADEAAILQRRQELLSTGAKVRIRSAVQLEKTCAGVIYSRPDTSSESSDSLDEAAAVESSQGTKLLTRWVQQHKDTTKVAFTDDELLEVGVSIYNEALESLQE